MLEYSQGRRKRFIRHTLRGENMCIACVLRSRRDKAYLYTRKINPHIPALKVWEYIKCLESKGLLEKAYDKV